MPDNFIDSTKTLFTKELIVKAAAYLGESQTGVTKAIEGIVPALLTGFINKAATNSGSGEIWNAAREQQQSGVLNNVDGFFANDGGGMLNKGARLFSSLFNEKADDIINLVANFSGTTKSSSATLLSVATPVILGSLGKYAAENNFTAADLSASLATQKNNFTAAIPSGLSLSSIFDNKQNISTNQTNEIKMTTENFNDDSNARSTSGLRILLPLLLLTLTAAAVVYFSKGSDNKEQHIIANNTIDSPSTVDLSIKNNAAGKVDANGDFIYDQGDTINFTLPDNAGVLKVGRYSTEAKICTFLQDGNSPIDSVKGNWFEFTNVRFKSGGAVIEEASMAQLKNMVAITKAFPTAQFKIGGYTDSTGTAATNIALSQKRADAVVAALLKLGATSKSIIGAKGYGPEHPIADNATPEGRAQNRRVAVNVKAK